jgi:hypothetical protein
VWVSFFTRGCTQNPKDPKPEKNLKKLERNPKNSKPKKALENPKNPIETQKPLKRNTFTKLNEHPNLT